MRRELKSWRHPDGVTLLNWCPECREYHTYGGPNWNGGKCVGTEGYRMLIQGPVPDYILKDSRSRKPMGPEAAEMLARPRPRVEPVPHDLIAAIMQRLDRLEEHLEPSLESEQSLEVGA